MAWDNERTIERLAKDLRQAVKNTRRTLEEIERKLEASYMFNGCGEMQNEQRSINIMTTELNAAIKARAYYKHLLK